MTNGPFAVDCLVGSDKVLLLVAHYSHPPSYPWNMKSKLATLLIVTLHWNALTVQVSLTYEGATFSAFELSCRYYQPMPTLVLIETVSLKMIFSVTSQHRRVSSSLPPFSQTCSRRPCCPCGSLPTIPITAAAAATTLPAPHVTMRKPGNETTTSSL